MSQGSAGFVHLHNHSDYSLLHGAMKVGGMVKRAKKLGMPAIALTDHGSLFGAVQFYLACQRAGIKPILGMEVTVSPDRFDHAPERAELGHPLVLLAETQTGWQNLIRLTSLGYLEGLVERPRLDKQALREWSDGIIALSAGPAGEVQQNLADGNLEGAKAAVLEYREIFGPDHFFLEVQNHGDEAEARRRELAGQVAAETGCRMVATNNCHYLTHDDAPAQDVLLAIQRGRTVDDPTRWRYPTDQHWLKSADEMRELFVDFPDAADNTVEIADRCTVELKMGQLLLPEFPLPDGFPDPDAYLEHLAREGLADRYATVGPEHEERLTHELTVIRNMGFAGYFLITGDFVRAAKAQEIAVGPGRGSAAGSLVCYCLGITDIDPLAHQLLFERFLNPERISMPDIDIDFCFERRQEIIDYVVEKYGQSSVCQIITYGTMLARGVLRDVGRALGLGYGEVDRIAKLVPEQLGITLEKALEDTEELRDVREDDPRYDRLIHTALQLEGLHRHASIHAAGILIAPGDLIDHVPLYKSGKDEFTTQWDMKDVEVMGLLKMDFLGLRTLTVIDKALRIVGATGGPTLRPENIDLSDPAIYELLGRGDTVGVFQLESSGMQEVLRKLKPSSFDDITAVNALYRPGPLGSGMVDDFIACKHGVKQIQYQHQMLEGILAETYGVILYQEQVMRIAGDMAGFTMGEADTLRKAMGKKKIEVMEEMKARFIEGAVAREIASHTAEQIFDRMAYFAGYGFNKSHSASYAVLSAQTAWLKAHHPAAFMASTLTSEMGNSARVVTLLHEVRALGIEVLPPDVNECSWEFEVVDGKLRYGLGAVKNVGQSAIEAVVEARGRLGRGFQSLYEFCDEIDLTRVNRRVVESLILCGATDSLPGRREQKLEALDLALARANRKARDRERGQADLFGDGSSEGQPDGVLPDAAAWTLKETLHREKELLSTYLSAHPLDEYAQLLGWLKPRTTRELGRLAEDESVALVGVVSALKTVTTRKTGELLAFVSVEDKAGSTEMICFAQPYEEGRQALASGEVLVFAGRTSRRDGEESRLLLEKVVPLDAACERIVTRIRIHLPSDLDGERADQLLALVAAHPGPRPLVLHVSEGDFDADLEASRAAVRPQPGLLLGLISLLGPERVRPEVVPLASLAPKTEKGPRRWRREKGASG